MPIDCILVEDEPLAAERLKSYIGRVAGLRLLGSFDNAADAIAFLGRARIDLLFLDVHLGEVSGLQLLEAARPSCEVVLTTAYPDYALKGFDLEVADYLLKPYTFERFVQAVSRVSANLRRQPPFPDRDYLFVKTEYRLEKLAYGSIYYIEGARDYRKIVTTGRPVLTLQKFTELEEKIPPSVICRVHKSYMVALDKIQSVEGDRIRVHDRLIPVSASYRDRFFALINR